MPQENRERPWENAVPADDAHRESGHALGRCAAAMDGIRVGAFIPFILLPRVCFYQYLKGLSLCQKIKRNGESQGGTDPR